MVFLNGKFGLTFAGDAPDSLFDCGELRVLDESNVEILARDLLLWVHNFRLLQQTVYASQGHRALIARHAKGLVSVIYAIERPTRAANWEEW